VDYGLAMKSDNGLLVTKHFALILRLNLMFHQKNAYQGAMVMHLLILLYQRKHNLPTWQMYTMSASVFNEEVGEISLSVLGRVTLGDTLKSDFEYMSKMYSLQHQYRAVADDVRKDEGRKRRNPHNDYKLDKRVLAQTKVTAFMLDAIVKIEAGTYQVYTGKREKTNPAYFKDAVADTETRKEPNNTIPLWAGHSSNEKKLVVILEKNKKKAMKKYCGDWGKRKIADIWPEMDNVPVLATGKAATKAAAADVAMQSANMGRGRSDSEESEDEGDKSSDPDVDEEDFRRLRDDLGGMDGKHNSDDDVPDDVPAPAPRKRGRPKGSKNN
jgi:hypothetical protein